MWGSGFTWLTFAIKYWNECSEQGYGLQLHSSKWRHYMWNRAERRANRLSTVTSEGPVTCRASLLYKRVTLPSRAQTSLCSQFNCATNRKICCIIPSCYPNDVQIIFVQGSHSMAKRSHAFQWIQRKREETQIWHREENFFFND